ncbi:MAG: hypothetical protein RR012_08535 [Oscillospiraceae bacterium]
MVNEHDVIIYDEEFNATALKIEGYCQSLISYITVYSKCIKDITSVAINDEKIVERLSSLVAEVDKIKPIIEEIKADASSNCKSFVLAVDDADKFLY